jgi:hypothetical protein
MTATPESDMIAPKMLWGLKRSFNSNAASKPMISGAVPFISAAFVTVVCCNPLYSSQPKPNTPVSPMPKSKAD